MSNSVLVAYATRGGSTTEVAQAIAAALEEAGVKAEVLPVSEVDSLAGKTALILGAPLYIGSFPKEFHQFVRRHRAALEAARPWCFVLGPTRREMKDFDAARNQATKQLGRYPWLRPVDLHVFGGKWNMNTLPFPFSLIGRLPAKLPAEDIRDWAAIKEWATEIARQIKPAA